MLKVVLLLFLYELEMVAFFLFDSFSIFYKFISKMLYAHNKFFT